MKALTYNLSNEYVNTTNDISDIKYCKDGRLLIYTIEKCKCCNQDIESIVQIPKGYRIQITD